MKKDKIKPELAAGFSDLSDSLLATKKRLIKIIEANYLRYGAQEIELPILEISSQIGSYLAEDESNPMADVFEFKNERLSLHKLKDKYNYGNLILKYPKQTI